MPVALLENPMIKPHRVKSLEDLHAYLNELFGVNLLLDSTNGYDFMFTVPGKLSQVVRLLQQKTGTTNWDGEASNWFYRDEARDILLGLSSSPGCVMVLASIASLHREALKKYGA
jgi:hypothetical protein